MHVHLQSGKEKEQNTLCGQKRNFRGRLPEERASETGFEE